MGGRRFTIRHGGNAFLALSKDGSALLSNKNGANLYLNADGKAATLQSQAGHLITMGQNTLLIAGKDGAAIEIKGDTINVIAPKINLCGASVGLGAGATDPVVMGNAFKILWAAIQNHVHPSAMGPTGPSPVLMPLTLIDGVHLSTSVAVK